VPLARGNGSSSGDHEFYRLEIHHFFTVYKALEPGKGVRDTAWADRAAAEAEVEASRRRLRATQG